MMKRLRYGMILMMLTATAVFGLAACDEKPETTEAVVTDGITDADVAANRPEVLPYVTAYRVLDKSNGFFAKHLLSENIEGLGVVFFVRRFGDSTWIRLGEDVLYTDENGRAALPGLRSRLPQSLLDQAPIDLQLQARLYFDKSTYVSDDQGLIRILSADKTKNPGVVYTDHDNTLHATGGQNAVQDWIDFLNFAKNDWPLVDGDVVSAVAQLQSENRQLVIVTGMPGDLRAACRTQMNRHFEQSGRRTIPIITKDDFSYEHSNVFKREVLALLSDLYGPDNCLAMVGDTVRQDGYGAIANGILYVPYQVNYALAPDLLDTEGFGPIDPDTVADTWTQVIDAVKNGPAIEDNVFLKRHNGFMNIAHRGGGELLPENTLEAYRNAYAVGAESIEGDVHMTSDGVIVVSHDETVDRCTDGTGKIMDKTLSEIKALDAGYRFTPDNGATYPCRGMGYTIPTLEEVFADPELNRRPMVLEIKQSGTLVVEKVLDLIEAYDMEDQLIVGAFNQDTVDLIGDLGRSRGMNLVRIFATEGVLEFIATPCWIMDEPDYAMPGDVLALPKEIVTHLLVQKAWVLGLKAYVWTVNDESGMVRFKDSARVDGIMTDNPERLEALLVP
ncbi:hypothetical protein JCM14469_04530 [Desulfatiferula olefinivorans]